MRNSARSPTPAMVPGRAWRGIWMRILGGSPPSASSHSAGVAINSPSASRVVMSASSVAGSCALSVTFLPCFLIVPLIGKLAQDALQLGAVGILQAELARDLLGADFAGIGADEGDDGVPVRKAIVVFSLHLATCLSGALLGRCFRRRARFRRRCLGWLATGARALLTASDFGLLAAFFTAAFFAGFGAAASAVGLCRLCGLGLLRLASLAAALGRALVDQRDRLRQRDGVLILVARNRGIDAAGGDVSAIAAVLDARRRRARDDRRAACRDRRRSGRGSGPWPPSPRSASPRG